MVAVMNTPEQVREAAQRVILRQINWPLYQQLQATRGELANPRFAYDRGVLEITVISFEHEQLNRLIAQLFETLADELELDYVNAGSTTFDRADLEQGFEPNTAFYLLNAGYVRGLTQIDLRTDPAPELVIEVDITHPSLNKFPIYAGLGIPEVWRYHKGRLIILRLADGQYQEQEVSAVLPSVTSAPLTQWIAEGLQSKRSEWLRKLRAWAQSLKQQDPTA
jgi:Uma2 family endonuclease